MTIKLPTEFKQKYERLMGEKEASQFFASFDNPVQKGFRINPLKINEHVINTDLNHPTSFAKWGYYGRVYGKTVDHISGLVYSQEPSAMLVGQIAQPQPGMKVLDLCAAPGGKTTYLASFLNQEGVLVSNEINRGRAKILAENVERFGIRNAVVLNESPDRMEQTFAGYFDLIVVDAPCSGEGMFRKDPDAMQYWNLDYPKECARRQKDILTSAMKMLSPKGQLVYSTCTFAPEEDEQIIAWLLDNYDNLNLEPLTKHPDMDDGRPEWANDNPALKNCLRLFPHHFNGEGHFMAKLQNDAPVKEVSHKKVKKNKKRHNSRNNSGLTKDQLSLWHEFEKNFFNQNTVNDQYLFTQKDKLSYRPFAMDLGKLKYIKPGLELGFFKKNRFEPSQSLLMAFGPDDFAKVVELKDDEWQRYVHGDVVTTDANFKGWVAVAYKGVVLGPGKLVQHQIKNFYPKGLRLNFVN